MWSTTMSRSRASARSARRNRWGSTLRGQVFGSRLLYDEGVDQRFDPDLIGEDEVLARAAYLHSRGSPARLLSVPPRAARSSAVQRAADVLHEQDEVQLVGGAGLELGDEVNVEVASVL